PQKQPGRYTSDTAQPPHRTGRPTAQSSYAATKTPPPRTRRTAPAQPQPSPTAAIRAIIPYPPLRPPDAQSSARNTSLPQNPAIAIAGFATPPQDIEPMHCNPWVHHRQHTQPRCPHPDTDSPPPHHTAHPTPPTRHNYHP